MAAPAAVVRGQGTAGHGLLPCLGDRNTAGGCRFHRHRPGDRLRDGAGTASSADPGPPAVPARPVARRLLPNAARGTVHAAATARPGPHRPCGGRSAQPAGRSTRGCTTRASPNSCWNGSVPPAPSAPSASTGARPPSLPGSPPRARHRAVQLLPRFWQRLYLQDLPPGLPRHQPGSGTAARSLPGGLRAGAGTRRLVRGDGPGATHPRRSPAIPARRGGRLAAGAARTWRGP